MGKIGSTSPSVILPALSDIITILQTLFTRAKELLSNTSTTATEGGTSNDSDRLYELVRASCNVIYIINETVLKDSMTTSGNSFKTEFMEKYVKSKPLLVSILGSIAREKKLYTE